ncbi:MAG: hypothetical protein WB781_01905 [Candidatus Sulfotelmatobacter sp.]
MAEKLGRRLFITGAVVLLLLGLVHSLSLFEKPVPVNDTERQLFDLMSNYKFNVMGSMRSWDNFMRGFSISFMFTALVLGTLDLALCRERAGLLKRVALINTIWLAAMIVVSLRYFFIFPTSFLATALLIFAAAWLKLPGEGKN